MSNSLEKYRKTVEAINSEYATLHSLTNDELRIKLHHIERFINEQEDKSDALNKSLVSVFAIVKETARRFSLGNIEVTATPNDLRIAEKYDFIKISRDKAIYQNHWDVMGVPYVWKMVHYDEQLLGGILLHYGYATEMATGEGKTLVATLPVFLNALTHEGVHIMTVNDYLSKRDFETTRPIYMFYGLSVDCIDNYERCDNHRKATYKSDIAFGTNSSFTFDYLFDHIAIKPEECVQQSHNYAIIDELDSILIDDADNPHIVGGGNYYNNGKIFKENYPLIKELIGNKDIELYKIDKLKKTAIFTQEGKEWLSLNKGIPDLFSIERTYEIADFDELAQDKQNEIKNKIYLQSVFQQLLLALTVYERDVDYIVEGGKVKIIDTHTGRVKETCRWEHGLHTAMEVKEQVEVQNDFDGMAVVSLKNYFRLYKKIAGMSGTIMPVKDELLEIYNLPCASLPTHEPLIRKDLPLRIFKTAQQKDDAIIKAIVDNKSVGRPSLVGSISVKRSEQICNKLDELGIEYNKLDAKTLKDEAYTIAKAGIGNTITVSTSVAGRGTDIKPSPEAIAAGGLMVIGTDLFESVRVDRQLKGRSGRQGDPGYSVFFASLEDQILQNLSPDDLKDLERLSDTYSMNEISTDEVRMYFNKAQSNREAYFKSCRKETARKDDIVDPHRKKMYKQRNAVLFNAEEANVIVDNIIKHLGENSCEIEEHLMSLHKNTKELVRRSTENNPNRTEVLVPFSEAMHTFAIRLEVGFIASYEYFCKEFKRQIILQIYDKEWKKFVLHIMSDLDRKEIELLDTKYRQMMDDINFIILSRLKYASIPFEVRNELLYNSKERKVEKEKPRKVNPAVPIAADEPCPCGSGKKYCECHGSNIRSNNRIKRRR
jgi:preprotein translocase subunit SecA